MRRSIIAGNWKMNMTLQDSLALAGGIKEGLKKPEDVEVVICPPYTSLMEVSREIAGSEILLGAQNVHWDKNGAYTGEISIPMLESVGCKYVIIGHSERRTLFGETDKFICKKVRTALKSTIIPILCIGETLEEREGFKTFSVVERQLKEGLKNAKISSANDIVVAYEPVWAIGTGKTATPEQAEDVHKFIRSLLDDMFGTTRSQGIRIQYGGSVKPENIAQLMENEDIDGALVGGASLKAESFIEIIRLSIS